MELTLEQIEAIDYTVQQLKNKKAADDYRKRVAERDAAIAAVIQAKEAEVAAVIQAKEAEIQMIKDDSATEIDDLYSKLPVSDESNPVN